MSAVVGGLRWRNGARPAMRVRQADIPFLEMESLMGRDWRMMKGRHTARKKARRVNMYQAEPTGSHGAAPYSAPVRRGVPIGQAPPLTSFHVAWAAGKEPAFLAVLGQPPMWLSAPEALCLFLRNSKATPIQNWALSLKGPCNQANARRFVCSTREGAQGVGNIGSTTFLGCSQKDKSPNLARSGNL